MSWAAPFILPIFGSLLCSCSSGHWTGINTPSSGGNPGWKRPQPLLYTGRRLTKYFILVAKPLEEVLPPFFFLRSHPNSQVQNPRKKVSHPPCPAAVVGNCEQACEWRMKARLRKGWDEATSCSFAAGTRLPQDYTDSSAFKMMLARCAGGLLFSPPFHQRQFIVG